MHGFAGFPEIPAGIKTSLFISWINKSELICLSMDLVSILQSIFLCILIFKISRDNSIIIDFGSVICSAIREVWSSATRENLSMLVAQLSLIYLFPVFRIYLMSYLKNND